MSLSLLLGEVLPDDGLVVPLLLQFAFDVVLVLQLVAVIDVVLVLFLYFVELLEVINNFVEPLLGLIHFHIHLSQLRDRSAIINFPMVILRISMVRLWVPRVEQETVHLMRHVLHLGHLIWESILGEEVLLGVALHIYYAICSYILVRH